VPAASRRRLVRHREDACRSREDCRFLTTIFLPPAHPAGVISSSYFRCPTIRINRTSTTSRRCRSLDDINRRLVTPSRRAQGRAGQGGGAAGDSRRRGRRTGQPAVSNLNITIHYRRSDNTNANPFRRRRTSTVTMGRPAPTRSRRPHAAVMRFDFNRQQSANADLTRSDRTSPPGGLLGVLKPFDWGGRSVFRPDLKSSATEGLVSLTLLNRAATVRRAPRRDLANARRPPGRRCLSERVQILVCDCCLLKSNRIDCSMPAFVKSRSPARPMR